jgi:formylglycine-generating enzyme required for sulfatase activity
MGVPGDGGPVIIEPVEFRTRPAVSRRRGGRPLRRILTGLLVFGVLALGGPAWFVVTARDVEITIEPGGSTSTVSGPWPLGVKIGGRTLMRPGSYRVEAMLEGYHPLGEPFEVTPDGDNDFRFEMRMLPGEITLRVVDEAHAGAIIDEPDLRVDGEPVPSPGEIIRLEHGPHTVTVDHPRYKPGEASIEVEGRGVAQTFTIGLRPDWADVRIDSVPAGAEVLVDGVPVASTPAEIELISGRHMLELRATGHRPWRRELEIVAEQPVTLTGVELERLPGRLIVSTTPPGAFITVGDIFAGRAPAEMEVPPGEPLDLLVVLDGYESASRTVAVGSDESREIGVDLVAQEGLVELVLDPPDAEVLVNGQPRSSSAGRYVLLAVEHEFAVSKPGYEPETRRIRPRPGIPQRLEISLTPVEKKEETARLTGSNGHVFRIIRPGRFMIGASRREQGRRSNETLREIGFVRPFMVSTHEVTNEQYREFDAGHRSGTFESVSLQGGDRPVVNVSWDDAARYCNWLSRLDGLPAAYAEEGGAMRAVEPMTTGYRLPTEAEWEYAARFVEGGPPLKYPWGGSYPPEKDAGNYADESASPILLRHIDGYDDGHDGPAPIGTFPPNPSGLFDMGGNAAEWCHDLYSTTTRRPGQVETDPMGPREGSHRVVRGSSWRHSTITALRLSYRDYSAEPRDDLGFRIARYLTEAPDE